MAEQRLSEVLTKKLGYYVPISEMGYETVWFMKDEIDEVIVPLHVIDHLADPIIADSASYIDEDDNYYLLLRIEVELFEHYEVWLVNDEVVNDFVEE